MDKLIILNQNNEIIEEHEQEVNEKLQANEYIKEDDVVLELGARFGSVSCIINKKLKNKKNQVSVEPDPRIYEVLKKNMINNNCDFNIVNGFISNKKLNIYYDTNDERLSYGTTSEYDENSKIPNYTLDEIKNKFGINKFTALVVDCEGCLENFLSDNKDILNDLRIILFEKDYDHKCNYDNIIKELINNNFKEVVSGFHSVYIKNNIENFKNFNIKKIKNNKYKYFFPIIILIIIFILFIYTKFKKNFKKFKFF